MPGLNEVKRGQVVEHDIAVYRVRSINRSAHTARAAGTLYRFRPETTPGGGRKDVTPGEKSRVNTEIPRLHERGLSDG